jgi:hypothetical protein
MNGADVKPTAMRTVMRWLMLGTLAALLPLMVSGDFHPASREITQERRPT